MIKIIGARGSGKTAKLIKYSTASGIPILVRNKVRANFVMQQAREMGCENMIYPLTWEDYHRYKLSGSHYQKAGILIDDVESVLEAIFNTVKIHAITLNSEEVNCIDYRKLHPWPKENPYLHKNKEKEND